ncbi:MAG: DEAD/DEAH box helicase [Dehalococcoidia bacterium]|nr:DEAD/DEAH box helicase [Dehalococcoidia bacterium]
MENPTLLLTLSKKSPRPENKEAQTPAIPAQPVRTMPAAEPAEGPSFADLGVASDLAAVLTKRGVTSPFAIQVLTIPDALAGRDVCGKAKTGSGKTLAFGLPVVERTEKGRRRRPRALILVPTRELALQVAESIGPLANARGLSLEAVYGGVPILRQVKALHMGCEIVVATPGRLNDLLERKEIQLTDLKLVVIDEADQMADMGFLPQVEQILSQAPGGHQTLLFSATLDGAIGELVARYQHDPVRHEVESPNQTVETVEQRFIGVEPDEKVATTAAICENAGRTIVFVRTKHGADRLAHQLNRRGLNAAPIHGDLNQNRRERTLRAFASGQSPVLVATNVAARGIHVDGVELVLHYDIPEDTKTYLHRSGRTARAGESGLVVTLVSPEQSRDMTRMQREAGVLVPIVRMAPADPRLKDLGNWQPPARQEPPATRIRERVNQPPRRFVPRDARGPAPRRHPAR